MSSTKLEFGWESAKSWSMPANREPDSAKIGQIWPASSKCGIGFPVDPGSLRVSVAQRTHTTPSAPTCPPPPRATGDRDVASRPAASTATAEEPWVLLGGRALGRVRWGPVEALYKMGRKPATIASELVALSPMPPNIGGEWPRLNGFRSDSEFGPGSLGIADVRARAIKGIQMARSALTRHADEAIVAQISGGTLYSPTKLGLLLKEMPKDESLQQLYLSRPRERCP